ncbi:MAG: sugar phosphate nucleotidyltransferase [Actinomycetota bacterium]
MRAIVLVGGEGTRLRPLTYTTPKPLLPIANVAFLERQLAWLGRHGVDEVVLSLGYLPDAFAAHFPEGRFGDVRVRHAVEHEPLGTAGGIRYAADEAGIDERFVVCNGDVLTGLDLSALVRFHGERGAEATIHLARVRDPSAFGVVPTRDDGEVKAFVEKPPPGRVPTDWINAGTYVLEPAVLERIPPRLTVSIERETFPRMLDRPGRLFAYQSDAYWIDIGTPEKYLQAHADLLGGGLGPDSLPSDAVERAPRVWRQGEVSVAADARIEPPVLIGAGSTIGAGARVARSVLGAECTVEEGAQVLRSVLLDRARLAPGAAAVDAVIGPQAVLEADAVVSDHTIVGESAVVSAGSKV